MVQPCLNADDRRAQYLLVRGYAGRLADMRRRDRYEDHDRAPNSSIVRVPVGALFDWLGALRLGRTFLIGSGVVGRPRRAPVGGRLEFRGLTCADLLDCVRDTTTSP
jgi:hypothetical protein